MLHTRTPTIARREPTIQLVVAVTVLDKRDTNFVSCERLALLGLSESVIKSYGQRKAAFDQAKQIDQNLKQVLFCIRDGHIRILEGSCAFLGEDDVRMWTIEPFDETGYRSIRLQNAGVSVKEDRLTWTCFTRKDGASHTFELGYSCILGPEVQAGLASVQTKVLS